MPLTTVFVGNLDKMGQTLDLYNIEKSVENFEEEAQKPLKGDGETDPNDQLQKMTDYQSYCKVSYYLSLV